MRYLHTMIRVSNLDQSLEFFCDILGLKLVKRKDFPEGKFSLIFLAAPGDFAEGADSQDSPLLELTYNWPADHITPSYSEGNAFGHLAFEVDDIYETCQNLVDHGIRINRPPRDGYMAFIRSPDGISIELLQKGQPKPPMRPWSEMPNEGTW